jgi:hypothetical protein
MSVWTCFQSIPTGCSLYARLHVDPAFNALMAAIFDHCGGAFRFVRSDEAGVEDYFDSLMEDDPNPLGPEPEARRILGEFRAEMERTRLDYPGLEARAAAFRGTYPEIHGRLSNALTSQRDDAAAWADLLIFGDRELAPDLPPPRGGRLALVSHPLICEGAGVLQALEPETLFGKSSEPDSYDSGYENYRDWRQLILSAAELEEEILVGVA